MLTLLRKRLFRNRVIARYLTLAIVITALVSLPLGLPGTNIARADCWTGLYCPNGAFNVAGLVSSLSVTWNGGTSWAIDFTPNANASIGSDTNPPFTCLTGGAQFIGINGATCGSGYTDANVKRLDVDTGTYPACPSGSFTVGFRFFAYLQPGGILTPYKVHGNLTINPGDFSYSGQVISNYAPVSGC